MLKYIIMITLFVLNCGFMWCLYGKLHPDEVVLLRLLVSLEHFKIFTDF
jgi:hypothetical protein